MLIQDSSNKWHYYSKNGDYIYKFTKGRVGGKGYHDTGERSFDSPEQFLHSNYNREGSLEEIKNNEVSNYEFSEAIILPTTSKQDNEAVAQFLLETNKSYDIGNNNCARAVGITLKSLGINVSFPSTISDSQGNGPINISPLPFLPNTLFRNLKTHYPNALITTKK